MNVKIIFSLLLALCLTSCDPLMDDFFYFIFGIEGISVSRKCEDNPSITSEGHFFEIYSIARNDIDNVVQGINNYSMPDSKYSKTYKTPIWKKTPVLDNDSVLVFIQYQFLIEKTEFSKKNKCFAESELREILQKEGNYYLFLEDNLGRIKLFMLDVGNRKLFLITSCFL